MNSDDDFLDYDSVDDRGTGGEIEFEPCTENEILKVGKRIKSNSAEIEGINLRTFKSVMCYLLPCLVHIINLSLRTSEFPDGLKRANGTPPFKGGSKQDVEHYRPISILILFSKLFEKLCIKGSMIILRKGGC